MGESGSHPDVVAVPKMEPGRSAKVRLRCGDQAVEAFAVNHEGQFYAYINRCAHVGTPLDAWPNEFFTEDGRLLICATHGAVYEPGTGLCVEGPCPGARLIPLPLQIRGDEILVGCPEGDRDAGRRSRS